MNVNVLDPFGDESAIRGAIHSILNAASGLTRLALSVCNEEVDYCLRSEGTHFCRDFAHRHCPGLVAQCEECDRRHAEEMLAAGKDFALYDCEPLGLKDFIVPVMFRKQTRWLLLGGAVRTTDTAVDDVCQTLEDYGCGIPRKELRSIVESRLPAIEPSMIQGALAMMQGIAKLLEQMITTAWEQSKLGHITEVDAVGRRLIGDIDAPRDNPLRAMSQLARALSDAANADACCVWKLDTEKNRLFALITSGFSRTKVLRLAGLDPEASLTGRAIRSRAHTAIADLQVWEDDVALVLRESLLDMDFRALLCAPVKLGDDTPGAVTVYRRRPGQFRMEEVELLEALAEHVWEAISKVEFSRSALAQADIARMLNLDRDSVDLYDKIARRARDWIGSRSCSIFFRRPESHRFCLEGTTGVAGGRDDRGYDEGQGLTGWVASTGKSLRVYDCGDNDELHAVDGALTWAHEVIDAAEEELVPGALRSFLASPISVAGRVCGVIRVYIASSSRSVFSSDDERLLATIGQELGTAWERFRLNEEVGRLLEDRDVKLRDVLAVHDAVANGMSKLDVAKLACDRITERKPTWRWVNLRVPDERQRELRFVHLTGPDAEGAEDLAFPLSGESMGAAVYVSRRELYCENVTEEARYRYSCPFDALSCFMLPIPISYNEIGVLTVDSSVAADFDESDQEYLRLVAAQLSTAMTLSSSIEALQQADTEKRAHIEAMAHQLVAPMFAMRSHCENLLDSRVTVERAKKVLVSLSAQSRIAARTASNFSILADILIGRTPGKKVHVAPHNLTRLLVEVARDYQPMAWDNETKVVARIDENRLLTVDYDERIFPQVIANVVENAVKYADDYTTVWIDVRRSRGKVEIKVTSEGVRLLPNEKETVFKRGFRSEKARLRFPPGTGIGLPIARAIVESHNGRIYAIPTDEAQKTTFVIELPLQQER